MRKPAKRPKRKDSHAALDRGLNAALERRLKETPKDRQKGFGRVGSDLLARLPTGKGKGRRHALLRPYGEFGRA